MTFRVFTAGEVLTAANLMQYVMRSNGRPVGFFTKSGTQSLTNGVDTAITWDTEAFDTDGAHSTVTNNSRYTVATAGKYRVGCNIEWGSSATGTRDLFFRVNNTTNYLKNHIGGAMPASNQTQYIGGILPVTFIVGDYIEVWASQSSGGALLLNVTAAEHWWDVEYVSE